MSNGGSVHAVVAAKRRDKVCSEFDKDTEIEQLRETLAKEYGEAGSSDAKLDAKLKVVRHLKRLFRCEGSFEAGADEVAALAPELENEVREDAVTVLGGHLVAIAPWANPTRAAFRALGATTIDLVSHAIPGEAWGPGTRYTAKVHRSSSTATASKNTAIFQRVQAVGCLGHHYTSHLAPGVFTNSNSNAGLDIRYDIENVPSGFSGVSVMAVSGCSMTCNLAQRALLAAFPRARFLGSRKTMPLFSGQKIWPAFRSVLRDQATPLLLDNTQDIDQVTQAWLRANITGLRSEAERLLKKSTPSPSSAQIEKKLQRILDSTGAGFADGRTAHRLVSSALGTQAINLGDSGNSCSRKADDRNVLVPPKGLALPTF
ncbi:MAG: hypothetical protein KUG77_27885 [Nannocystaceae bacterium]|nr:hypothetical protein [Nannocystaceae bacterium]